MEKWKANIRSNALSLIDFGQWLSVYSRKLSGAGNGMSWDCIENTKHKTQNTFNGHLK